MAFKDLLGAVAFGAQDEDLFTSLANRLIRLEKQLTDSEKERFAELTGGQSIRGAVKDLLNAYDPDRIEERTQALVHAIPEPDRTPGQTDALRQQAQEELVTRAAAPFTGELNDYLENVRRLHEQIIDTVNQDQVLRAEWDAYSTDKAKEVVQDFTDYMEAHKDEITALSLFYDQPYRRRELTFRMIKELLETLKQDKPLLAPHYVWDAYAQLEEVGGDGTANRSPKNELVALVSLIRRVAGIDPTLTSYHKTVDKNFQDWVFRRHAGSGEKFTEAQMAWLRLLKDHVVTSFHVEMDDLNYTPFDAQGGRGRMWQLFGERMDEIIEELNDALVA